MDVRDGKGDVDPTLKELTYTSFSAQRGEGFIICAMVESPSDRAL